jgi:DNA repair exonuclease SbcCD ATPase subunit
MDLAQRKDPDTIERIEARIKALSLEPVAGDIQRLESLQSRTNRHAEVIESLQRQFSEASNAVAQRISELQRLICSKQDAERKLAEEKIASTFASVRTSFTREEATLRSLDFTDLGNAVLGKHKVVELRAVVLCETRTINSVWETFGAKHGFPTKEVEDIRSWSSRLVGLCDTNLPLLDKAIQRLRAEVVSNFQSQLQICRSVCHDVEARYEALPSQGRIESIQQLRDELATPVSQLKSIYETARDYETVRQIKASDLDFGPFDRAIIRYQREIDALNLAAFDFREFSVRVKYCQSYLDKLPERTAQLFGKDRSGNLAKLENLVDDVTSLMSVLWKDGQVVVIAEEEFPEEAATVRSTRSRMLDEYEKHLQRARELIDSLTPPPSGGAQGQAQSQLSEEELAEECHRKMNASLIEGELENRAALYRRMN